MIKRKNNMHVTTTIKKSKMKSLKNKIIKKKNINTKCVKSTKICMKPIININLKDHETTRKMNDLDLSIYKMLRDNDNIDYEKFVGECFIDSSKIK